MADLQSKRFLQKFRNISVLRLQSFYQGSTDRPVLDFDIFPGSGPVCFSKIITPSGFGAWIPAYDNENGIWYRVEKWYSFDKIMLQIVKWYSSTKMKIHTILSGMVCFIWWTWMASWIFEIFLNCFVWWKTVFNFLSK